MLPGVALLGTECFIVLAPLNEVPSTRVISAWRNMGRDAVLRVMRSGTIGGGRHRSGLKWKLPKRAVILMMRVVCTGKFTALEVQARYEPMVTVRHIKQILAAEQTIKWDRMPVAPALTPNYKGDRLKCAREVVRKGGDF